MGSQTGETGRTEPLDAVVIGAGFGGMYMAHRLRAMGLSLAGFEAGGDVGGVWYWNRYPGARCDLMSIDYSYSFSREIEQEWVWSEQFAAQPEILAYAQFVAERLDLRSLFRFNTRVISARFDDSAQVWTITTDRGETINARYCIMATGPLSVPKVPDFPGLDAFRGDVLHAARWPHEPVSFTGKRVGLIGTGSTGIQIVPCVAAEARQLFVFQRTPSFSLPMRNSKLSPDYLAEVQRNYAGIRAAARNSALGGVRPSTTRPFFSLPRDQRRALMEDSWQRGGLAFLGTFADLLTNPEANEQVAEFVRSKVDTVVENPATAETLKPRGYPIFARRPCLDTGYYEAFNLPSVQLVDCLAEPIARATERGLRTTAREYDLDMLILATGYDGLTGAMLAFPISGRDGRDLGTKWSDGARSYLGILVEGFPNLFMVCGANGPAALANIITLNEQNVDWICGVITHLQNEGLATIEATASAETEWMDHVATLAETTLLSKARTWYVGANIAGKPTGLTLYSGGFARYRDTCDQVVRDGYRGLVFGQDHRLLA